MKNEKQVNKYLELWRSYYPQEYFRLTDEQTDSLRTAAETTFEKFDSLTLDCMIDFADRTYAKERSLDKFTRFSQDYILSFYNDAIASIRRERAQADNAPLEEQKRRHERLTSHNPRFAELCNWLHDNARETGRNIAIRDFPKLFEGETYNAKLIEDYEHIANEYEQMCLDAQVVPFRTGTAKEKRVHEQVCREMREENGEVCA